LDKVSLISFLKSEGYLKTPRIIGAFNKIDRKDFVAKRSAEHAYLDTPLPIGFDQTISQPLVVAFMIELLDPKPGEVILDVGSGSGWTTALLAQLVSQKGGDGISENQSKNLRESTGYVVAVDRIPELCEMTRKNVSKYNFLKAGIVKVICGDGSKLMSENVPTEIISKLLPRESASVLRRSASREATIFDKILSGASAEALPEIWKQELKIGGRIVAPVENSIVVLTKKSQAEFEEKSYYGFRFVPLISD
jgi:protein-L-isoaspartate(D-aspartate) O-methyltransferase